MTCALARRRRQHAVTARTPRAGARGAPVAGDAELLGDRALPFSSCARSTTAWWVPPLSSGIARIRGGNGARLTCARCSAARSCSAGTSWRSRGSTSSTTGLRRSRPTSTSCACACAASKLRSRIGPRPPNASTQPATADEPPVERPPRSTYRPWAELLRRTFAIDALECPKCQGRMHLLAIVTEPRQVRRFLAEIGEPTEPPARSPNRGPPYWQSTVLRRSTLGDAA